MSRKRLYYRLLGDVYLWGQGWLSVMLVVLITIQVSLSVYLPVLVGQAIDSMIDGEMVSRFYRELVIMGVLVTVNTILLALISWLSNRIVYTYIKRIRQVLLGKYHSLSLARLNTFSTGDMISLVGSDTEQLSSGLLLFGTPLYSGLLLLVLTFVSMRRVDSLLLLVVIVSTPLSLLVAQRVAKKSFIYQQHQLLARGELTTFVEETVYNIPVIQNLSGQTVFEEEMARLTTHYNDQSLKALFYASLTNPCTRYVNAMIYAGLTGFGVYRIFGNQLSVGGLVTFLTYVSQYTKPLNDLSLVLSDWQNALACAQRVYTLADMEEISEISDGTSQKLIEGHVVFEDVSFSYNDHQTLIQDFSLSVPAGSRVAIVGETGAGKSTLFHLLMRFYEIEKGRILIDGQSISDLSLKHLREQIGLVSQEPWLIDGTIYDNIAYGQPDVDQSQVEAAAQAVGADFFIRQLPEGYATRLTDNASRLSQGQKQLLTIARVLLKQPRLLLLDEATSSIDSRTDVLIQDAFQTIMAGRTSFIIAHRLATVQSADMIVVMKEGSIIECGRHDELMAKKGYYHDLQRSHQMR